MNLSEDECRTAFAAARIARLATADATGTPHLVPVTFAVDGESVCFAVDAKPKRSHRLRRLRNIGMNPRVSLLVDEYREEWEHLWWVRVDGLAQMLETGAEHDRAVGMLCAKYPQYAEAVPEGPVVGIEVTQWSGWRYAEELL